jgi:hypothetical protein
MSYKVFNWEGNYNIENEEIVLPAISVHLADKMQGHVVSTQVLHGSHLFVSQSSSLSVVIHFTAESFNEGGGGDVQHKVYL